MATQAQKSERQPERRSARQAIEGSQQVALNIGEGVGEGAKVYAGTVGPGGHLGDTIYNNQIVSEVQFQELDLESYAPNRWVDPSAAEGLVQLLADHRLLFVAGELRDKRACARHLALRLRERLAPGRKLCVRERYQTRDPQRIEPALEDAPPTLLLLTDLSPEQLTVDSPAKLRALLADRDGYAIVTTDCSQTEWGIEGASLESRVWRELSWESYYGRELLTEFLLRNLDPLPEGLLPEPAGEPELVAGLPLREVIGRLPSPAEVRDFAGWLQSTTDRSAPAIRKELETRAGDGQAIVTWYRRFDPREQLLVLGLTLLDGLPDSLVFAGLELLVAGPWRDSDPMLPQFDYRDLGRISTYFKTVGSADGSGKIECAQREIRLTILDHLWSQQRRRMLAALPALAELLRWVDEPTVEAEPERAEAASGGSPVPQEARREPARDGDDEKDSGRLIQSDNRLLQRALVDSLVLIGRRSFAAVEPQFIDLLADRSENLRNLAARAVAGLRMNGGSVGLFKLLDRWWRIGVDFDSRSYVLELIARTRINPHAVLRAAIARIVGFSALLDRPNRLAPELSALLSVLVEDTDREVRAAVVSKALPSAVAWHFRQLEPFLRTKVLTSPELIPAVAAGAAEACRQRPEEALAILDGWRAAARADRRPNSPLPREHLLATVAATCGRISCDPARPGLAPEAIGARLKSMLAEEEHPFVRRYVFHAIQLQAVRDFEMVAAILKDVVEGISLSDRPAAVEVFVRTYLAQRERLTGGETQEVIGSQRFDVWTTTTRPLTEIETVLFSWILDDRSPVAQQLAVDVFEALAETALERAEARLRLGEVATGPVANALPAKTTRKRRPRLHRLPLLGWMATYLAAPRKRQVRALLRPLLAELLVVRRRGAAPRADFTSWIQRPLVQGVPLLRAMALVYRWARAANEATRAVARHLLVALALYRWRWGIVSLVLVLLITGILGGRALYQRWTEASEVSAPAAAMGEPEHASDDPLGIP